MPIKRLLPCLAILLTVMGCYRGSPLTPVATATRAATSTPTFVPTPTFTPIPTLTPTPAPAAHLESASQALALGDYNRALDEYQAVLDGSSDDETKAQAWVGLGRAHYALQEYPEALDALREVSDNYAQSPAMAQAEFYLGETFNALKRYPEAAEAYEKYLSLRPGLLDAYVQELRGDALVATGDYPGAIAAYSQATQGDHLEDYSALEVKLARTYADSGDFTTAIKMYDSIYTSADSDYTKADVDFLCGQAYLALGDPTSAKDRFIDAVVNFPRSSSSYAALVTLVNNGMAVSDYYRGVVDYFAGQYNAALAALDRYVQSATNQDGSAYYYEALTLDALGDYAGAISAWEALIQNYPESEYWADAWEEKAYILWADLDQYKPAAQTLLDLVKSNPSSSQAPQAIFDAARIYERANLLTEAAQTWERLGSEYPSSDQTFRGLFLAGVTYYRLANLSSAILSFQRSLLLAVNPEDQAAANLWIGKIEQAQNNAAAAQAAWQQAERADPTGYYSERARDLLSGQNPFTPPATLDMGYDLRSEQPEAETWLKKEFNLPAGTDLSGLGTLADDPRIKRGQEYISLGLYTEAQAEFESLRQEVSSDPVATYRLANYLYSQGFYRSAIQAGRQVLTLAGMNDTQSLNAPRFFTHLRFGTYYRDLVMSNSLSEGIDPLLVFSQMRQESLFDGYARSSAGARGLMQIVPSTGASIAANMAWPANYTDNDLYRPIVSARLGIHYLSQQVSYFDGDMFAALAAYNAGPGNAAAWNELAGGDPDLFLEVVRIQETRDYIMHIYEVYSIYRWLFNRP
ncbi:MAG: tetratricopeptide repeat protein [Chloroflexi bacterium]|nr:tetratricopeptide repeat protein [Chloroflexota bacterium]